MQQRLIEAVKHGFPDDKNWALVIGDLMLDRYLWGEVERISPDAPVPVVVIKRETECAWSSAPGSSTYELLMVTASTPSGPRASGSVKIAAECP
ncbi:MAG TPA: hypothetical protein PLH03_07910 [Methylophilaceae bacterium]|nr:hypothetical protein [Methylophilaceae bacterium]